MKNSYRVLLNTQCAAKNSARWFGAYSQMVRRSERTSSEPPCSSQRFQSATCFTADERRADETPALVTTGSFTGSSSISATRKILESQKNTAKSGMWLLPNGNLDRTRARGFRLGYPSASARRPRLEARKW